MRARPPAGATSLACGSPHSMRPRPSQDDSLGHRRIRPLVGRPSGRRRWGLVRTAGAIVGSYFPGYLCRSGIAAGRDHDRAGRNRVVGADPLESSPTSEADERGRRHSNRDSGPRPGPLCAHHRRPDVAESDLCRGRRETAIAGGAGRGAARLRRRARPVPVLGGRAADRARLSRSGRWKGSASTSPTRCTTRWNRD